MKILNIIMEELSVGDKTNAGVIQDEYGDQFKIDGKWYHKTIVKPSESLKRGNNNNSIAEKNDNFISVDIQPEYMDSIGFLGNYIEFLNNNSQNYNRMLFLYNGEDLGMISEDEYINWLLEHGLDEDVLDNIEFFDKAYGFFRVLMDNGVDKMDIVKVIQYMMNKNYEDSRDFSDEDWEYINNELGSDEIQDLLGYGDAIYLPEVFDLIKDFPDGVDVCGGGYDECLGEILIMFKALNKKYDKINKFIY